MEKIKKTCRNCEKDFERELSWTLDTSVMGEFCCDECMKEWIKKESKYVSWPAQ